MKRLPPHSEENPNKECGRYSVNIEQEDLINIYVKKWVLEWCKKYHPEAFEKADEFVRDLIKSDEMEIKNI